MSNSSASSLHESLLRPAILQILRAAGFHATRPSVLDTLTDLAARHLLLLASKTAANASVIHSDLIPCITDVRLALQDSGVIVAPLTAAEETWREMLRKPLDQYPERNGLRAKERARRDAEDTADVREFLDWITGEKNREIRRAAGMFNDEVQGVELEATGQTEDYLTALKKKHSKTGEESRYQGTVLGKPAEDRPIKIEGGPADSFQEWVRQTQERAAKQSISAYSNSHVSEMAEARTASDG
ncbi:hypothetical protein W97_01184 [Coniosporium apollinis CBS 100218]|uniref:Bromodomain associated domain-containing protein n=1 Tax=Coniosporium apollinis (strain CBS 100218) TaxID=1168221 RepID=R7YJZ7_CONA1|nr:uncharacterized protein W97_01184 [Coniosporium apollinis CBS 100218]EON61966.1 hypothetical protein W97_01184 [Coniosporium apollinis CBS 100218]